MTSEREWLARDAQSRVEAAIREVESKSAAEIVVTVRKSSGNYRAADLLFGSAMSFAALLVYVYHPAEFSDDLVPPAILLLFVISAFFCSELAPLRRALTRRSVRLENVRRAALTELHEQRVTATAGRTGIFIYVSLFERVVEVVPDLGVDPRQLGNDGAEALAEIRGAVCNGGVDALVRGLDRLGGPLARCLPRAADDVNELPDGVVS